MPEVKYTCPQCKATLKSANPVPAGKKIKCPKCGNPFAPTAPAVEKTAPPKPAPGAHASPSPEDEEAHTYTFSDEGPAKDAGGKVEEEPMKRVLFMPSTTPGKRVAAQGKVTRPSNGLLFSGFASCVLALVVIILYVFPMIFSEQKLTPDETVASWTNIIYGVVMFLYGGLLVNAASKMQNLESYGWALWGSILALIPVACICWLITMPMGVWCLMTLKDPNVRAGFKEKKPDD